MRFLTVLEYIIGVVVYNRCGGFVGLCRGIVGLVVFGVVCEAFVFCGWLVILFV